jgi:hypothetical protein
MGRCVTAVIRTATANEDPISMRAVEVVYYHDDYLAFTPFSSRT